VDIVIARKRGLPSKSNERETLRSITIAVEVEHIGGDGAIGAGVDAGSKAQFS
jgi:hypothetical protein